MAILLNQFLKTILIDHAVFTFFHILQKSNKIAIRLLSNAFQTNLLTTLGKIFTTFNKIVVVIRVI